MNIIFLDFDGVLNSKQFVRSLGKEWNGSQLDPIAVKKLNRLVFETKADIVISSFWRVIYSLDELRNILISYGAEVNVIDKTKILYDDRANEIIDWWDNNKPDNFVILDDDFLTVDETKFLDPLLKQRFIRTSSKVGLQESDVDLAIQILTAGYLLAE